MTIALLLPQFSFLFFNTPILAIQLPQFNFFYYKFLAISLPKFLFLSPTSITSFLSPLSYFFLEFRQWCCRNSLLFSFWQISLNSTHITNKLHFLQYSAKRLWLSILLFKGLPLFGILFFLFRNAQTLLCLSRDKTKGQYSKNTTLTPTKILPKKYGHSPIDF